MDDRHITDERQLLAQLARRGAENRQETSAVVSPGARVTAWAVTVKSHVAYNVYLVRAVAPEGMGIAPSEMGEPMAAVNLAESFVAQGTVPAGTHALMCAVGDRNFFYAVPPVTQGESSPAPATAANRRSS